MEAGDEGEAAGEASLPMLGGTALNLSARPYEELLVDVSGCTGTLIPHNSEGVARYVLTARHCLDGGVTPNSRVVRRGTDEQLLGRGKAIDMHPDRALLRRWRRRWRTHLLRHFHDDSDG